MPHAIERPSEDSFVELLRELERRKRPELKIARLDVLLRDLDLGVEPD